MVKLEHCGIALSVLLFVLQKKAIWGVTGSATTSALRDRSLGDIP